jgi:small-conductance mechanosensitive channel
MGGLFSGSFVMAAEGITGAWTPVRFQGLDHWLNLLGRPSVLTEFAALVACVVLAWLLAWSARRALTGEGQMPVLFGRRLLDGVLCPVLLLLLVYAAFGALKAAGIPQVLLRLALPVLISLALIRVGVKVLQAAFKQAPLVRLLERWISWLAWLTVVLWITGLLPLLLGELDSISWRVGGSRLTALDLLGGALTAGGVLIVSLWISSALEDRLLRSATGGDLSLRKAVSNAVRALLVGIGLLLGLTAVGIDLTALSVLGGAIGVGVGLGLQKLAASYVSGFVMLAERSVRIGDNVRIDGFEGRITDIKARYTIVRALSGRESVVPNEMFIGNRIENLSLTDPKVVQTTVISVGYGSDVDQVMQLLETAARQQSRVLQEPAPAAHLSNFGPDGLEFTLNYWIIDPENGQGNLRSDINLAILRALREHRIEIPYPQRVVHAVKSGV